MSMEPAGFTLTDRDAVELVQARALATRIAKRLAQESYRSTDLDRVRGLGRVIASAEYASDALFDVLNCAASYCDDQRAKRALRQPEPASDEVA